MTKETDNDVAANKAPTRAGSIRRFFDGWKRLEKAMDYSAYDYTVDRIQAFEKRLLQLESASATDVPIDVVQAQDGRLAPVSNCASPIDHLNPPNNR
jgi:hypothetical protein